MTKAGKGINRQKARRLDTKSTQQRRKTTGMNNKDTVEKHLQALPNSTPSSQLTEIMTADPFKIALKNPALETGHFLKPFVKFKLQLFPIDEFTRKALLEVNHNPFLELTLRPRKKISSVVKHLNIKWPRRTSSVLMLFPYDTQSENIVDRRNWTLKDTETTAADVYIAVGQPEVFRLRYGWFSDLEIKTFEMSSTSLASEDNLQSRRDETIKINNEENQLCPLILQEIGPVSANERVNSTLDKPVPSDESIKIVQNQGVGSSTLLSWVDCVTSVSIGQLLSEAPDANHSDPLPSERNTSFKQISLNCDSFDAAIADLIARNQGSHNSAQSSHSSIWDAEETRHAFPIQDAGSLVKDNAHLSCGSAPVQDHASEEPLNYLKSDSQDDACHEPSNLQLEPQVPHSDETILGLSNFCWPDSSGPFEFGVSPKHIIGGDGISLSGLIASSLDAFQNCSFFGMEKAPSTGTS